MNTPSVPAKDAPAVTTGSAPAAAVVEPGQRENVDRKSPVAASEGAVAGGTPSINSCADPAAAAGDSATTSRAAPTNSCSVGRSRLPRRGAAEVSGTETVAAMPNLQGGKEQGVERVGTCIFHMMTRRCPERISEFPAIMERFQGEEAKMLEIVAAIFGDGDFYAPPGGSTPPPPATAGTPSPAPTSLARELSAGAAPSAEPSTRHRLPNAPNVATAAAVGSVVAAGEPLAAGAEYSWGGLGKYMADVDAGRVGGLRSPSHADRPAKSAAPAGVTTPANREISVCYPPSPARAPTREKIDGDAQEIFQQRVRRMSSGAVPTPASAPTHGTAAAARSAPSS